MGWVNPSRAPRLLWNINLANKLGSLLLLLHEILKTLEHHVDVRNSKLLLENIELYCKDILDVIISVKIKRKHKRKYKKNVLQQ